MTFGDILEKNGAYIVDYVRSPIGRAFKGSMTDIRADDLLSEIILNLFSRNPEISTTDYEDFLVGCGLPGGEQGFNIARVVSVLSKQNNLPAATVNRYCGSSIQTTRNAAHAIMAGMHDLVLVGGVECTSRFVNGSSDNEANFNPKFESAIQRTSSISFENSSWEETEVEKYPDVYIAMGETAENVANLKNVSREDMDKFALSSHQKATKALKEGRFDNEIADVYDLPKIDECIRQDTSLEALSSLLPVFRPMGKVTAGNSCPLNDGAAAMIVASGKYVLENNLNVSARIIGSGVVGLNPEIMGLGPIEAVKLASQRAGISVKDIDIFELNEAFAAQVIPCAQELNIDFDNLNVNGGAIALGHPFGMTGVRIIGTLANILKQEDKEIGCATLCVGGGQGMAVIIKREG